MDFKEGDGRKDMIMRALPSITRKESTLGGGGDSVQPQADGNKNDLWVQLISLKWQYAIPIKKQRVSCGRHQALRIYKHDVLNLVCVEK